MAEGTVKIANYATDTIKRDKRFLKLGTKVKLNIEKLKNLTKDFTA
jgi:hypothetical protein